MGLDIASWFINKPQAEEVETDNYEYEAPIEVIPTDGAPLEQKLESIKSEKFRNFLNQLNVFKAVSSMNTLARYQAAQLSSGITFEEINENIAAMSQSLSNEKTIYHNNAEALNRKAVGEIVSSIESDEIKIEENLKRIEELNIANKQFSDEITEHKKRVEDENAKTSKDLLTFDAQCDNLRKDITALESEIKINLRGQSTVEGDR